MANILERKIFMGANTADGFVGWFDKIVDNYGLKKLYIMKGGCGTGKSTFIKNFCSTIIDNTEKDLTIDYLMCSADPESHDGVIIHELGLGIIDGTYPHITDPKYPGVVDEILDFSRFILPSKVKVTKTELKKLNDEKAACYKRAYAELQKAREAHQEIERHMTPAVDFSRIDKLLKALITKELRNS